MNDDERQFIRPSGGRRIGVLKVDCLLLKIAVKEIAKTTIIKELSEVKFIGINTANRVTLEAK